MMFYKFLWNKVMTQKQAMQMTFLSLSYNKHSKKYIYDKKQHRNICITLNLKHSPKLLAKT